MTSESPMPSPTPTPTQSETPTPTPTQSETPSPSPTPTPSPQSAQPPVDDKEALRQRVLHAIQQVYDPEIPVNIFELGLIYGVDIDDEGNVNIKMTLTSPACPAAQDLPLEVRGGVSVLLGVKDVDVDIVFDPPWTSDKMSEVAKVQLGMM